jgi:parvulin-like peptidyl-prolyl isomerase
VKTRILLSVIALALAGCGSGNAVVATVNDADITKTLVDELRSAEVVSKADYANDIRDSIFEHLLTKAAQTEYGFTVVESDAEARYQELVSQVVAGNGTTYEQFLTDQGITDARVRRAASQQVLREAVEARLLPEITDDEVRDAFDKSPGEQFTVCSKHILSATADEATEIISMLSHGSDFAELAVEFSTDPTAADTGGDLGCNPASLFVEPFATAIVAADLDEVVGPVETEFGFHVIVVLDRQERVFEEAEPTLRATLDQARAQEQATKFFDWFDGVIKAAKIDIDPSFGTWVLEPVPQVLPAE